ncbi:Nramp family divalent metal transporter [Coprobacter sp.]
MTYHKTLYHTITHTHIFEFLRYIGPGLLVTVGFIDPGNWASNLAAGGEYGYSLLWMVTFSTIMLIALQHNAARLGIVTGLCLSEAATIYLKPISSNLLLGSAIIASISTSLAEILGGAIALQMLFGIPIKFGALIIVLLVVFMLFNNNYRLVEKWIIAFVSIIGLSFVYELSLTSIDWSVAAQAWIIPSFPKGSMVIIMSVLGAVVMPHNLFLHSEIIQNRRYITKTKSRIRHRLRYEYIDTSFSMILGWAINSAMILLAATTFFNNNIHVTDLQQAESLLSPLLGKSATIIFAVALLFAGIASTITSGMAGGSILAGIYKKPYDIKNTYSKRGIILSLFVAYLIILLITQPFDGLIYSQIILSVQLPFTIFSQVQLTSSDKVMGIYKNSKTAQFILYFFGIIVTILNIILLFSIIK